MFRWVNFTFFHLFSNYFPFWGNLWREFLPNTCMFAISPDPGAFLQLIRHSQPVRAAAVNIVLQELLKEQN